jgi:DtxR family Mn-dependent transcriptional regulator
MTQKKTRLSDSLEDYLEIILALEKSNKVARVKDIAGEMGVLRGSVSSALKTPQGAAIAREISRRHEVIKDFLINVLQIDPKKAETNACRMEHVMDKASIDRLVLFIKYIHSSTQISSDWIQSVANDHSKDQRDKRK